MDFSHADRAHETSTEALLERWNELPSLGDSPFDSAWRNNTLPPCTTLEPQAVHPDQLHSTLWSPSLASDTNSAASGASSRTSASSNISLNDATAPFTTEYRPRGPTGKRKGATRRITPKSKKHAHELSRNRTAATKYRTRQKSYVDGLQQKCKDAEMKRQLKMSMVQSLRDELFGLRRELLKHTHCGDANVRNYGWNVASSLS